MYHHRHDCPELRGIPPNPQGLLRGWSDTMFSTEVLLVFLLLLLPVVEAEDKPELSGVVRRIQKVSKYISGWCEVHKKGIDCVPRHAALFVISPLCPSAHDRGTPWHGPRRLALKEVRAPSCPTQQTEQQRGCVQEVTGCLSSEQAAYAPISPHIAKSVHEGLYIHTSLHECYGHSRLS